MKDRPGFSFWADVAACGIDARAFFRTDGPTWQQIREQLEAEWQAEEATSHPAVRLLKALGKDPVNTWFRTFVPRRGANGHRSGRDLHGFDAAALEADNRAGEAIYFITGDADQATGKNKKGKPTGCVCDDDITHCRALFVEWDDRPIEWQRTAWQELKLPEPSLQVKTGGKSIQCYWLLTHAMAPAEWHVLQSRLIDFASGDPKCKNPSRLMRLPGFRYVDKETRELTDRVAELVHQADVAYSAAEIEACIPVPERPPAKGAAVSVSGIARALEKAMELPPRSKAQLLEALKVVPEFHHNEGRRDELLGLAMRLRVEWGPEEAQEWLERHSPTVTDMASYFSGKDPEQIKDGGIWPFLRDHYGVDLTRHDLKRSASGEGSVPAELGAMHFAVLGWADGDRDGIYYRAKATGQIALTKCRTRTDLLRMAPLEYWIEVFGRPPEEQGRPRQAPPDWDAATSAVISEADQAGVFDLGSLRGHGVWLDAGRVVWHLGDRIEVDGSMCSLEAVHGKFHYARLHALGVDPQVVPLQNAEGEAVLSVLRQMGWGSPVDPLHLAGWIVLANVGGALPKRPGLQLTSSSGSGKSDCVTQVIEPLLGGLAVYSSTSSEAGVRQSLKSSSLPAVIDESEQENAKKREAQLRLVRLSYDGVPQLMGTPSGEARSFAMRSSICLVGINATIPNVADRNRIVVISRLQIPDDAWAVVSRRRDELITRETGERLLRRTVSNLKTLLANVESFRRVVAKRYGGRAGDTYGALLAGAHHLTSLELLDEAQARQWIDTQRWALSDEELAGSAAKDEAEQCLEHLLKYEVPFVDGVASDWGRISDSSGRASIREVIQFLTASNRDIARGCGEDYIKSGQRILGKNGLKVDLERGLLVHTGKKGKLDEIYSGTRWANGAFKDRLLDLPGAEKVPSPPRFPVIGTVSCIALPLSLAGD